MAVSHDVLTAGADATHVHSHLAYSTCAPNVQSIAYVHRRDVFDQVRVYATPDNFATRSLVYVSRQELRTPRFAIDMVVLATTVVVFSVDDKLFRWENGTLANVSLPQRRHTSTGARLVHAWAGIFQEILFTRSYIILL